MKNETFSSALTDAGFIFDPELNIWTETTWEKFNYNDGDEYENYVLDVVSNSKDCSVMSTELASKIKDWPSLYHLTPKRANLLRPFAKQLSGKRVLEIGCGCGAVTRFLAESGAEVTAVEGSRRRATIARRRCYDLDNVQVICASSEKLPDLGEFDYVLLIGVLEYAQSFLGVNGQQKLLEWCRARLAATGSLFIAIENKLGLKYLSGAKEDHLGVPMVGINNAYPELGVRTLGRNELKDLINIAGFRHIDEYLPFPDYKLPTLMIAPAGHSSKSDTLYPLVCESYHKDAQPSTDYTFSLEEATRSVWQNGLSADLANSFLMIATPSEAAPAEDKNLAWYYSESRKENRQKYINFICDGEGIQANVFRIDGEFVLSEKYHYGESLWLGLVSIMNKHGWQRQQIVAWVKHWITIIAPGTQSDAVLPWDYKLDPELLDATPFNIIATAHGYEIFDLELKSETSLNISNLIFRGLFHSFLRITSVSPTGDVADYNIFALTKDIVADVFPDAAEDLCERYLQDEVALMQQIATVDTSRLHHNYKNVSFLARNFLNDYRIELARINQLNEQHILSAQEQAKLLMSAQEQAKLTAQEQAKLLLSAQEQAKLSAQEHEKQQVINLDCQEENRKIKEELHALNTKLNEIVNSREWKMVSAFRRFTSRFKK